MPPQKKPKAPQPPRKVQAPQTRGGGRDSMDRQRLILYAIAASGIVALIVVIALVAFGGGSSSDSNVAKAMTAAGCTYKSVKASVPNGQTHVNSLTAKLPWNTSPPSNGQHYPAWAVWGFYTQPINPRQVVHNEEHGGVVYWWGPDVPQSTIEKLRQIYEEEPTGTFGTPYANFGSKVAVTAWTGNPAQYGRNGNYGQGHIAVCPTFNDKTADAIRTFRDAFRGKGPEGIPLSADAPGLGPQ